MPWFDNLKSPKLKKLKKGASTTPEGLWKKCTSCAEILQVSKLEENLNVCPYCQHHFRLDAVTRVQALVDENSFQELGESMISNDPLLFSDKKPYRERLDEAKEKTGQNDGTLLGLAKIHGQSCALAVMDFNYMGGSMGAITGEKIALCFDLAFEHRVPAIVINCSGGARMQEGIVSLMQMAKTSGARQRLKNQGIPYIAVLTDPTTGGCAASFAMLGDITIAEPKALIGFAGPRVIEQSIRQTLPEGFQRAEFLLEHGFIDQITTRKDLKNELGFYLKFFQRS